MKKQLKSFDSTLFKEIRSLIMTARHAMMRHIDTVQVMTSFEIGRRIVEHEQKGAARAQYGKQLLVDLAVKLTHEFGSGFSERNLRYMRRFYLVYQDRMEQIRQTPSAKLVKPVFRLSWSQYIFLIGVKDGDVRNFYEIEAAQNNWTLPELSRQFNSGLYERLALSRDKGRVRELAKKGQVIARHEDLLKEPYVLEFLGIDEKEKYSESDLESAIISKLEHFLLELGKGFLFEARQKRFTFDEDHFFVDLVFYNRLLKCYVLIDLKIGKLTHQDLGQMQMYVNYFDRHVKSEDEGSTVGIVLCRKNREALVEITLPKDAHIHAKEYCLYLPSQEELRLKLIDWTNSEAAIAGEQTAG